MDALTAPLRVDVSFARAHSDLRRAVRLHGDAIYATMDGTDRDAGSADLDVSFRLIAQHAERDGAAPKLQEIAIVVELRQPNFGVRSKPHHVCVIELHFGARPFAGQ